jgi:hypothetical protein
MDVLRRQGSEQRDARGRWLPGANPAGASPWRKGQAPNPSGRGGDYHEMQRLAREFTPRATEILREIADDPNEDSRNRIVAIGMLYDRAWGKPKEYDPKSEQPEDKGTFNPRDFSPQELIEIERVLRLMKERAEAVRAGKARRPQAEILPPERRLHRRA